jgi:hypothetical protein
MPDIDYCVSCGLPVLSADEVCHCPGAASARLHERARRQLAVTIATDLLTVQGADGPMLGTRLAIKERTTLRGDERYLGGWCTSALENQIEKTIRDVEGGRE